MAVKVYTYTLHTAGVNGSAVAVRAQKFGRGGIVRAIAVDYTNEPATVDLVIKANSSTGPTLFTNTSSNTDIAPKPVGMPGVDEGNAALASTDASAGGWPFESGLYFDVAQGDAAGTVEVKLWIDR